MAFTRTVTLYGADLSSFLAAGGTTVDPNEPAATPVANALNFPVAVSSSSPLNVRPAAVTTTPVSATNKIVTLPGGPSSAATAPTSRAAAASASLAAPLVRSSSSSATPLASTTAAVRTTATGASSRRPSASASSAANLANAKKQSAGGLSGGAIAAVVIGVLAALAILAAAVFLIRKRKSDKRRRNAAIAEKRNPRSPEKGAFRLDETEVPGGGFDFGPLVPIAAGAGAGAFGAASAGAFGRNTPQRSASPALTLDRAAVLGIQRPLTPSATPPPGHPGGARPSPSLGVQQSGFGQPQMQAPYPTGRGTPPMQQMRMAPGAGMMPLGGMPQGQQQQQRSYSPHMQQQMLPHQQMPRKPVEAATNPFADGVHNSPSLSSMVAPVEQSSSASMPVAAAGVAAAAAAAAGSAAVLAPPPARRSSHDSKRMSASSFAVGDDSFEESVPAVAERAESPNEPFKKHDSAELPSRSQSVSKALEETAEAAPAAAPVVSADVAVPAQLQATQAENGPLRTKSVAAATDNWAARKEHLKKTLASSQHSASPKASPAQAQDPFTDAHATPQVAAAAAASSPALQDTPVLSPMDFSFATQFPNESQGDVHRQ